MSQRMEALTKGQSRRLEIARIREELRGDPDGLRATLLDPPEVLANLTVLDVLRLPLHKRGATPAITKVGRRAATARINLLEPMGAPSSRRAREWAARYGVEHRPRATARRTA